MAILPEDIAAVRSVLTGEMTIETARVRLSNNQKAILMATVWTAGGRTGILFRGYPGSFMSHLVGYDDGVFAASRRLKLHIARRNGDDYRITAPNEVWTLLDEDDTRQAAAELYRAVNLKVLIAKRRDEAAVERGKQIVRALGRHYQLREIADVMRRYSPQGRGEALREIHALLGDILEIYGPD